MATTGDASAFPGGDGFAQGVVEIVGPDLDRSLDFYLLLGFELLRRSEGFAVVHWQGQRLFPAENPAAPTTQHWHRSEGRRVGKEVGTSGRCRGATYH